MRPETPAVGGYEGVGEVYSIGSAVKGLLPGDLVIPSPPSFGKFSFPYSSVVLLTHWKIFWSNIMFTVINDFLTNI